MFEPDTAEKIHEPKVAFEKQVQLLFLTCAPSQVYRLGSSAKVSWLSLFPLSLLGLGLSLYGTMCLSHLPTH